MDKTLCTTCGTDITDRWQFKRPREDKDKVECAKCAGYMIPYVEYYYNPSAIWQGGLMRVWSEGFPQKAMER